MDKEFNQQISSAVGVPIHYINDGSGGEPKEKLKLYSKYNDKIERQKFYYTKLLPLKSLMEKHNPDGFHYIKQE